jgi:hypothetical protein
VTRGTLGRCLDWLFGSDDADVPVFLWVLLGFFAVVLLWALAQGLGYSSAALFVH